MDVIFITLTKETEEPRGQDQQLPGDEIGDTEVVKILKTDAESMTDKSVRKILAVNLANAKAYTSHDQCSFFFGFQYIATTT